MVDLVAHEIVSSSVWLSKEQRRKLAGVLHNVCMIDGKKTTVLAGIDIMTDSMRESVLANMILQIWSIIQPSAKGSAGQGGGTSSI